MNRFITFLLLLASAVALAQEALDLDAILAGGVTDQELAMLRDRVPWTGAHVEDPLAPMVRWDSVLDSSLCTTEPPPGWGTAVYVYEVTNTTRQPIVLTVDGAMVDVAITKYAGREQLPAVVIAQTARGTERFTALPPGRTCYSILPYKSPEVLARHMIDWRIRAHRLVHRGPPGVFMQTTVPLPSGAGAEGLSTILLYSAPLFDGSTYEDHFQAAVHGKTHFVAVFRDRNFI